MYSMRLPQSVILGTRNVMRVWWVSYELRITPLWGWCLFISYTGWLK